MRQVKREQEAEQTASLGLTRMKHRVALSIIGLQARDPFQVQVG